MFLNSIPIKQDVISVFGSGGSINDLTEEKVGEIFDKTFLITMNYAPLKFKSHLNIWSDARVTMKLEEHYALTPVDRFLMARDVAFDYKGCWLKDISKYRFDKTKEILYGDLTLPIVLQLLQKYFPEKKVHIYGLDLYVKNEEEKWYDKTTDYDKKMREEKFYNIKLQNEKCGELLDRFIENKGMFLNMNRKSWYEGFRKFSSVL